MQPSNPTQPRGSFAKSAELTKSINQHEATRGQPPKAAPAPTPAPAATPASATEVKETAPSVQLSEKEQQELAERERIEKFNAYKSEVEKDLGASLSDTDMRTYLFKGRLSKVVDVVPGYMRGTFQTLRGDEYQAIEVRMAKIRDEGNLTPNGLENEKAIISLSYAWTHAAEADQEQRPIGQAPEEREKRIRMMGALVVERADRVRTAFETLIRLGMNERGLTKK